MKTAITESLATVLTPTAIALGNFDGIHRGHRQVIQPVVRAAARGNLYPSVVTFFPHPQEFFSGKRRCLLTPVGEKRQQLEVMGIAQLVLLPFNLQLASLSPQEFVELIIVKQLQARLVSVGTDFCFGRNRSGTAEDLQAIAASYGVEVIVVSLELCKEGRISSSLIRQALELGNLSQANRLLGRAYSLVGKVIKGQQLGRKLGFPTANLELPPEKFLPRQGVYSVRVSSPGFGNEASVPGVLNLGCRPTIDGTSQTVEVHILDWSGDLYGQELMVSLKEFLRPEQKFASLDALKAQIQIDCERARSQF